MSERADTDAGSDWLQRVLAAGPTLYGIAMGILHDAATAEDVVAETYLRAWQHRRDLTDARRLSAWLRRIARNCALDIRRRQRARPIEPDVQDVERLPASHEPPDEQLIHEELLDRLPESLKACARLSFIDGLGCLEIASLQRLPLSTVKGRIYSAREHLRKEIAMSAEPVQPRQDAYDDDTIPVAPDRTLVWRGMKARLLGVGRIGQRRLYTPEGKRLSRIPAAVARSRVFQRPEQIVLSGDTDEHDRAWVFFALSGKVKGYMGIGTHTSVRNTCRTIGEDRLLCSLATLPPGHDGWLRIKSLLIGEVVQDEDAAVHFRWDFARGSASTAVPGWGAIFTFPARPGQDANTCALPLTYSSSKATADWAVSGVTDDGCEHRSISIDQANSGCAEGEVTGVTVTLPMPPDQLAEIVFRPRRHARAKWGKAKIPAPQA